MAWSLTNAKSDAADGGASRRWLATMRWSVSSMVVGVEEGCG
jgi:hypothetical protein